MSKFIALDIGNTNVTVGLWDEGRWMREWRFTTKAPRTRDEWAILLDGALRSTDLSGLTDRSCGIASVVPALTEDLHAALSSLGLAPSIASHELLRGVRITYEPPTAVGVDRICGVAAALRVHGAPVIIVDLGTATVVDVVSKDSVYLGGVIAPGVATAAESLNRNAALLPRVELQFPASVIGNTTAAAIQSGILNGALAMIDGLVEQAQAVIGPSPVVATGGFAELLKTRSRTITAVDLTLVLEGIRLLVTNK